MVVRSHAVISCILCVMGVKGLLLGQEWVKKGDKSVASRARSRRWAAFIAILVCHGEEANGIFCTVFTGAQNHKCVWHSQPFTV